MTHFPLTSANRRLIENVSGYRRCNGHAGRLNPQAKPSIPLREYLRALPEKSPGQKVTVWRAERYWGHCHVDGEDARAPAIRPRLRPAGQGLTCQSRVTAWPVCLSVRA